MPWPSRAWKPLSFSNPNFPRISLDQKLEEELFPDYISSRYYPARIGEIFRGRYQIVGKLGFGASSTVWLARDLKLVHASYQERMVLLTDISVAVDMSH
jgi:hypothetical protein